MKRIAKRVSIVILAVIAGYATFTAFGPTYLSTLRPLVDFNALGFRLLVSFGVGLTVITAYTGYAAYKEGDKKRRINDLTQLYTGVVLILSITAILAANAITSWTIEDLYIVFATTVLTISLLTMKRYNRLIEKYA